MGQYTDALARGRRPIEEWETTTTEQQITETIYLGLRTSDGIDMARFEKTFQMGFHQRYGDVLQALCEEKLMKVKNDRCFLTPEGMLFHDSVVDRLL